MDRNEIEVRHIATAVPLSLHTELRQIAAKEGQSMARFFRSTLVDRLETERKKSRRRRTASE